MKKILFHKVAIITLLLCLFQSATHNFLTFTFSNSSIQLFSDCGGGFNRGNG